MKKIISLMLVFSLIMCIPVFAADVIMKNKPVYHDKIEENDISLKGKDVPTEFIDLSENNYVGTIEKFRFSINTNKGFTNTTTMNVSLTGIDSNYFDTHLEKAVYIKVYKKSIWIDPVIAQVEITSGTSGELSLNNLISSYNYYITISKTNDGIYLEDLTLTVEQ